MRPRSAVALVVSVASVALAAGAGSPPAAAEAPRLDTSYPCYGSDESMVLSGSGFTPGGSVALSASGQQLATIDADPDGGFSARIDAPGALFGPIRLRFTAADLESPALRAGTTVRVADTDVVVTPEVGAPARLRRIRAWGFFDAPAVYAHVKRHGARRARNIRLGRPRGACGTIDVRRRLFPRGVRPGAYTLQFDALRRYYRNLVPSVSYLVAIFGPSTTQTAAEWPRGFPPATPFSPARVTRVARFTTTSR